MEYDYLSILQRLKDQTDIPEEVLALEEAVTALKYFQRMDTESADDLISRELARACRLNGSTFKNGHEAKAVIEEEYEETISEMVKFEKFFRLFWDAVKDDNEEGKNGFLSELSETTTRMVAEAVQLGAMVRKAQNKEKHDGLC